ncbi:MAG: type II secretion system F family protein, partial [Epsilonproteobacteria bacterium]|nr:type II secretion system F family protein [Campylobacterota bacterium]
MVFKYKGIDKKSGKKVKGHIDAKDINEAKRKLQAKGILYESLKEGKGSTFSFAFNRKRSLPADKLASISRNLSIYLKSGIPLVNVIRLAKSQYEDEPRIYDFFSSIENSLDEGKSFYKALETQEIIALPTFYKQSIKVAEESGTLEAVLLELAKYLKDQDKIQGKVKQALVYPSFIIVISLFMVGFMLTVVVPKITNMFSQLHQELPKSTQFVIAVGDFFTKHWLFVALSILIAAIIFSYFYKNSEKFKYAVDLALLKTPFIGKISQTSDLARFAYMVSILVKSGVPFVQAVKLSSNIIGNDVLKKQFKKAANDVVEGKNLSVALVKHNAFV